MPALCPAMILLWKSQTWTNRHGFLIFATHAFYKSMIHLSLFFLR